MSRIVTESVTVSGRYATSDLPRLLRILDTVQADAPTAQRHRAASRLDSAQAFEGAVRVALRAALKAMGPEPTRTHLQEQA